MNETSQPAFEDAGDEEMVRVVVDEEKTLARLQKHLAARAARPEAAESDYDAQLIALRTQIQEARAEDVPPLIEEMERLSEVRARRQKVSQGTVDPSSPYFGRLVLEESGRKREVLIGKSTYLDATTNTRIVDWRDAPVSRIFYRYEEGDDYEEDFGGRQMVGEVLIRRNLSISSARLRRVGSPQGSFAKSMENKWRRVAASATKLAGGQGAAMRPEEHHQPGRLGTGRSDGREDKFLPEITALIDPRQFELISRTDSGLVIIQGGAGSGKTTIGLHRMAYLVFQNPQRFRPDRMLIMVFNEALVRYISKVLPSLGAAGVPVTTYVGWAEKLRKGHLKGLPDVYAEDTPSAVTRFKKHPAMLKLIDAHVARADAAISAELKSIIEKLEDGAAVLRFWTALPARTQPGVRLTRLKQWLFTDVTDKEALRELRENDWPVPPAQAELKQAVERVIHWARREHLDVSAAWGEMLTNEESITKIFAEHAATEFDVDDMRTVMLWCRERCNAVIGGVSSHREGDTREEAKEAREAQREARKRARAGDDQDAGDPDAEQLKLEARERRKETKRLESTGQDDEDSSADDDRSVGIDGRAEEADLEIDREDDAILLRLIQKLRAPITRGRDRLRYEHILIDEAQDLSPVELAVVLGTTTKDRSVTMAGDTAQRLHMDNGFRGWKQLLADVGMKGLHNDSLSVEPLRVQYRSTHEIIEFSNAVLGPLAMPDAGKAVRNGAPVELFTFDQTGEAVAFLAEALREVMTHESHASVVVVARYPEQADLYYQGLKKAEVPQLRRIAEQDFPFKAGIDVTDIKQVKGLEFDYVILVEVGAASYGNNDEARHLLHIGATRAAHQLWVTTTGVVSPLLPPALLKRSY